MMDVLSFQLITFSKLQMSYSFVLCCQPPTTLRSSETFSEQEATEIAATKLLLSSYFDIVRKIIEDSVPKAIMHFLVSFLTVFSIMKVPYARYELELIVCY